MSHELPLPDVQPESTKEMMVHYEALPGELLPYSQWVCWRYVDRGEGKKPDKQPVNPRNLHNAGVHWANTWSTSKHAYMTYLAHAGKGIDGIGFVLTKDDPFVGVDIDNCIVSGEITSQAQEVVQQLQSYTEVSPSGHGLRILVTCTEYAGNRRSESLEVYSHSRFLTLTGNQISDTPASIAAVQHAALQTLLPPKVEETRPHNQAKPNNAVTEVDTEALWQRIFQHDRYGEQHLRRFQGDISLDNGDHSLTVIRLLNSLARWTACDAVKIRAMMLMSPLANEKWFSKRGKQDWLDYQITNAIGYVRGRKSRL